MHNRKQTCSGDAPVIPQKFVIKASRSSDMMGEWISLMSCKVQKAMGFEIRTEKFVKRSGICRSDAVNRWRWMRDERMKGWRGRRREKEEEEEEGWNVFIGDQQRRSTNRRVRPTKLPNRHSQLFQSASHAFTFAFFLSNHPIQLGLLCAGAGVRCRPAWRDSPYPAR